MKHKIKKEYLVLVGLVALLIISGAAMGYFIYQNYQLKKQGLALENELLTTTKNMNSAISSLSSELLQTKTERDDLEQKYNSEKNRMDLFASQMSEIEGAVEILEKLNKTDPELLQKYSKVYFLNENYVPETLVKISSQYTYNPDKEYLFYLKTLPFLQNLISAATRSDINIKIISAYRSFGTQSELKSNYKMIYGSGSNQFSADQGYSEHQLGTAVDLTTPEIGATFSGFEKTEAYQWLLDNAYQYGFILSYPENNSYYQFEPWHWRFVGRSLADKLRQDGKNFYDLDQRELDQYLLFFFD